MAFQFGAQAKDRQSIEGFSTKFIQPVQDAEANSRAAAQTSRPRDFFHGGAGKSKPPAFASHKKKIGGLGYDWRKRFTFCRARDGHEVVNPKGDAKAVEARPEIGSAGRDADCDLICHSEQSEESLIILAEEKQKSEMFSVRLAPLAQGRLSK